MAREGRRIAEGGSIGYLFAITKSIAIRVCTIKTEDIVLVAVGGCLDGQTVEISGSSTAEVIVANATMTGVTWNTIQCRVLCSRVRLKESFAVRIPRVGQVGCNANSQDYQSKSAANTNRA